MKIALIGNPNVGKTTIYNILTQSKEKTGNYPGITVELKSKTILENHKRYTIVDFPGIYSLFPESSDEKLSYESLTDSCSQFYPDIVFFILDWNNLRRGLFLYQQVRNLNIPIIILINKIKKTKLSSQENQKKISHHFMNFYGHNVYFFYNKKKYDSKKLFNYMNSIKPLKKCIFQFPKNYNYLKQYVIQNENPYLLWLQLAHVNQNLKNKKNQLIISTHKIIPKRLQISETVNLNKKNNEFLKELQPFIKTSTEKMTELIDKIVLKPILGYFIFFLLLFVIFQFLFKFSQYPIRFIENTVNIFSIILKNNLPKSPLTSLLIDGVISGIGGILVFIPQISFLFFCILFLEQIGYLSRVVFLMDPIMKPFGLNGKSTIPLVSGIACAVPAIIAARNIENSIERTLTILVTPLVTCSARLPVYSVLIALIIPKISYFGFNLQGLVLMGMYFLGILTALLSAIVLKKITLKKNSSSYLVIEMPNYRFPSLKNIFIDIIQKCKEFIFGAGKITFAVSIILWGLSSFSPKSNLKKWSPPKIEYSFLGIAGKFIEPIISPLGFDWKIGIGIITSIAAREVFIGTLNIVYSLDNFNESKIKSTPLNVIKLINNELFNFKEDSDDLLIVKMKNDIFSKTKKPVYNLASGFSLMIFYSFSMQCISTISVVKKELNSWKLAFLQFIGMTFFAYFCSWLVYIILS